MIMKVTFGSDYWQHLVFLQLGVLIPSSLLCFSTQIISEMMQRADTLTLCFPVYSLSIAGMERLISLIKCKLYYSLGIFKIFFKNLLLASIKPISTGGNISFYAHNSTIMNYLIISEYGTILINVVLCACLHDSYSTCTCQF